MLLMGEYHHQIDEKSRIRIPAKLKDALGESPVILKGTDGCLFVYSQEAMNNMFATKFANNDFTQADKTKALRLLTSSTVVTEEDKQGRILLPQNLIKHAGIVKNIVTIGAFDRVEIWSEERWNEYANLDSDGYDECLKKIASKEALYELSRSRFIQRVFRQPQYQARRNVFRRHARWRWTFRGNLDARWQPYRNRS